MSFSSVKIADTGSVPVASRDEKDKAVRPLFVYAQKAKVERPYPDWLVQELRSNHAGETGAVCIYKGALVLLRDPLVRREAEEHLRHEQDHLYAMNLLLEASEKSRLVSLWKIAGYTLGFIGALGGAKGHHLTVEAVETFVDLHYGAQIDRLERDGTHPSVLKVLRICRDEEVQHRDEAAEELGSSRGPIAKLWAWIVGTGSKTAVSVARSV